MKQTTFLNLSVLAFGLVIASFLIRGLSRFVVASETASLLSAPTMFLAAGLVVFLTVRSVLAVSGIRPLQ